MSKITTTLPNITANSSISSLSIANGTTAFTYANTGYDQGGIPVESMMPKQALSSEQMKYAIENVKSIGYTVDREFAQYVNIISGYSEYNISDLSWLIGYASKYDLTFKQCLAQIGRYLTGLEMSMVVDSLNYILEKTNQELPLQLLIITPHFKDADIQAIIDCFKLVNRINTKNYIDFSPSSINFT